LVEVGLQLKGAGDKRWELMNQWLELVLDPSSEGMQNAATDRDDGLGLEG
jgi:hypothetical protein